MYDLGRLRHVIDGNHERALVPNSQLQFTLPQLFAGMVWLAVIMASSQYLPSSRKDSYVFFTGMFSIAVISLPVIVVVYLRFYNPDGLRVAGVTADRVRILVTVLLAEVLLSELTTVIVVSDSKWLSVVAGFARIVSSLVPVALVAVRAPARRTVFIWMVFALAALGLLLLFVHTALSQRFEWTPEKLSAFADQFLYSMALLCVAMVSGLLLTMLDPLRE
ncbi:MAG TPA: hypothetical protein VGY66_10050, partial [Gemmataceae bacterium]|nr:hypothetical protein [Gemmataceae bacterium]